ncbi:hypothetical protein WICPIJ_004587 [Wickerhamomyces pijperi]|uniref:DUF8032 domain-containing protein n=1 Tax=Wickerhamomyces pijperi TaxID=599730 RepID=A0A9P8TMS1_WICPI|nr:hypothetical protein WICPIJ_004587 [Wickerhamomyces pijperi]
MSHSNPPLKNPSEVEHQHSIHHNPQQPPKQIPVHHHIQHLPQHNHHHHMAMFFDTHYNQWVPHQSRVLPGFPINTSNYELDQLQSPMVEFTDNQQIFQSTSSSSSSQLLLNEDSLGLPYEQVSAVSLEPQLPSGIIQFQSSTIGHMHPTNAPLQLQQQQQNSTLSLQQTSDTKNSAEDFAGQQSPFQSVEPINNYHTTPLVQIPHLNNVTSTNTTQDNMAVTGCSITSPESATISAHAQTLSPVPRDLSRLYFKDLYTVTSSASHSNDIKNQGVISDRHFARPLSPDSPAGPGSSVEALQDRDPYWIPWDFNRGRRFAVFLANIDERVGADISIIDEVETIVKTELGSSKTTDNEILTPYIEPVSSMDKTVKRAKLGRKTCSSGSRSLKPGPKPYNPPKILNSDPVTNIETLQFEYSIKSKKITHTITVPPISIQQLDHLTKHLSPRFKFNNSVYPKALVEKSQYTGNRYWYENETNMIGWILCDWNQAIMLGNKGLIQRAVDSWRNTRKDQRVVSRRVKKRQNMEG